MRKDSDPVYVIVSTDGSGFQRVPYITIGKIKQPVIQYTEAGAQQFMTQAEMECLGSSVEVVRFETKKDLRKKFKNILLW